MIQHNLPARFFGEDGGANKKIVLKTKRVELHRNLAIIGARKILLRFGTKATGVRKLRPNCALLTPVKLRKDGHGIVSSLATSA